MTMKVKVVSFVVLGIVTADHPGIDLMYAEIFSSLILVISQHDTGSATGTYQDIVLASVHPEYSATIFVAHDIPPSLS